MPQNSITDIVINHDGQMIIATYSGVVVFDGAKFSSIIPGSNKEFPQMEAFTLAIAADDAIWVGTTTQGVYRFKGDEISHWDNENGLSANLIRSIKVDKKAVYIRNDDKHYKIENNNLNIISEITMPNSSNINEQPESFENSLLLFNESKVWHLDNTKLKLLNIIKGNQEFNNILNTIVFNEQLLITDENKIVSYKNGELISFIPEFSDSYNTQITTMVTGKNNTLWIGTSNNGVFRYSNLGVEKLNGLPNNHITAIVNDKDGVPWIATSGGLCALKLQPFSSISKSDGLENNFIRYVNSTKDNQIYLTYGPTTNNLTSIKNNTVYTQNIKPLESKKAVNINAITTDEQGQLWIAASNFIGTITDGEINVKIEHKEPITHLLYANNAFWFVSGKQLYKSNNNQTEKIQFKQSNLIFNALSLANNGNVLITTKTDIFEIIHNKPVKIDLTLSYAFCAHKFTTDELWVCGEGLWLRKNNKNYHFGYKEGITDGHVHAIAEDDNSNIWASTNSGLFKISRENIDSIGQVKQPSKLFMHFSEKDGLLSSEFNGSRNGATKTSDGKLWFAGQGGVTVINPSLLNKYSDKKLKPYIEHMYVDEKLIQLENHIATMPNPNSVHFHFGAIFLSETQNLSFRSILTPFQNQWQKGNSADYLDLAPGTYHLKVQARYKDNNWSETLMKDFEIPPAWYQTWWLRLSVAILSILLVYVVPLIRIRRLKKNKKELDALVIKQTTSLSLANEKLQRLANYDELTQIANRRTFINKAKRVCQNPKQIFCLALIDVDDFKAYNDFYGHLAGDEALKAVADALNSIHSDNCCIARFGGEEFVILFNLMQLNEARKLLLKTYEYLAERSIEHEKSSTTKILTLSTGLVTRKDGEVIEEVLDRADLAMYNAKTDGKNRIVVG